MLFLVDVIIFSDGKTVGACLDRNGLRPARYWRTSDNVVYVASEVCLLSLDLILMVDIKKYITKCMMGLINLQ